MLPVPVVKLVALAVANFVASRARFLCGNVLAAATMVAEPLEAGTAMVPQDCKTRDAFFLSSGEVSEADISFLPPQAAWPAMINSHSA